MKNNSRFIKVAIAAGLVTAVGGAVLGVTSFASANSSQIEVVRADSSTDSTDNTDNAADGAVDANRPDFLATAAEVLGMTEDELKTELESGKSIADVAKAKGVDVQKVIDALVALSNSEALDRITELVNNPGMPQRGFGGGHGPGHGPGDKGMHGRMRGQFISDAVTSLLKLTKDEIRTQLQSGKSLADIAKAQDVSVDKLIDTIVADFKAHLDEEVANGEHTQAEADQKLADFTSRITDIVNGVLPQGMPDGGPDGDGDGDHGMMDDSSTSNSGGLSGTVTN